MHIYVLVWITEGRVRHLRESDDFLYGTRDGFFGARTVPDTVGSWEIAIYCESGGNIQLILFGYIEMQ